MKLGINYSRDLKEALNDGICLITGGYYPHCSVRFEKDDGSVVYFESIFKTDKTTRKNGLRGPIPIQNLLDWKDESSFHKVYLQPWLPVTSAQAKAAYDYLLAHVPLIKYASLQLGKNARYAITKRWTINRKGSANVWQCAETVGRALMVADASIVINFLGIGDVVLDMLVPSGKRGIGLFERTEAILRGHGSLVSANLQK